MNMATKIQEWCEDVWDDNYFEDSKIKKCKAIGAMLLSGAIDGAVIMYPVLLVACVMAGSNIRKLQNK